MDTNVYFFTSRSHGVAEKKEGKSEDMKTNKAREQNNWGGM